MELPLVLSHTCLFHYWMRIMSHPKALNFCIYYIMESNFCLPMARLSGPKRIWWPWKDSSISTVWNALSLHMQVYYESGRPKCTRSPQSLSCSPAGRGDPIHSGWVSLLNFSSFQHGISGRFGSVFKLPLQYNYTKKWISVSTCSSIQLCDRMAVAWHL